jgi:hypothetical protein
VWYNQPQVPAVSRVLISKVSPVLCPHPQVPFIDFMVPIIFFFGTCFLLLYFHKYFKDFPFKLIILIAGRLQVLVYPESRAIKAKQMPSDSSAGDGIVLSVVAF